MLIIELKAALLIDTVNHPVGALVMVPDKRAEELVKEGFAVYHPGTSTPVANPDHNQLGDLIEPLPRPDGSAPLPPILDDVDIPEMIQRAKTRSKASKVNPESVAPNPAAPVDVAAEVRADPVGETKPQSIADALEAAKLKTTGRQGSAETATLSGPPETAATLMDKVQ